VTLTPSSWGHCESWRVQSFPPALSTPLQKALLSQNALLQTPFYICVMGSQLRRHHWEIQHQQTYREYTSSCSLESLWLQRVPCSIFIFIIAVLIELYVVGNRERELRISPQDRFFWLGEGLALAGSPAKASGHPHDRKAIMISSAQTQ
jgi:hypothetical protein